MKMTIYFDNAATTFPKPEVVYRTMEKVMRNVANPGRSGHKMALESGRMIYHTRELLASLFSIRDPMHIVFTHNATDSLNLAIKGLLKQGDHVITTSMEHNSVLRPLKRLENLGIIQVTIVKANQEGNVAVEDIKQAIQESTKMVISTHASNVTGTLLPIDEIGRITQEHDLIYMVDASQTAGIYDIDVNQMKIDLLAFPGHKSLLGPQGVGGLYLREGIDLNPLREGGTGSQSESLIQPTMLPDRYESGTQNTIGIAGLGAGVEFILKTGIENIKKHEEKLTQRFLDGLKGMKKILVYGPKNAKEQGAVVSIYIEGLDVSEASFLLDNEYDIACRSGLHCAPLAHRTIDTFKQGTLRFSMGYFNTLGEVDQVLEAIETLSKRSK